MRPILVTGGTGMLGRQVVSRLREAGRDVRVLSRQGRDGQDGLAFVTGDLAAGEGLAAAVRGAGTIVHCASSRKGDAAATRNLPRSAAQSGGRTASGVHLADKPGLS
jgi:nucleoside-diphosphate-sugar epimerase